VFSSSWGGLVREKVSDSRNSGSSCVLAKKDIGFTSIDSLSRPKAIFVEALLNNKLIIASPEVAVVKITRLSANKRWFKGEQDLAILKPRRR
jgi:hypothetical protein